MKSAQKTGTLNVRLASDAALIDEVVVVAYGTRKKGTIAGAVSAVKSEKLENVPAAGFDQALQGQTPGLSVISIRENLVKAAVFPDSRYQLNQFGYIPAVYSRRCAYFQC